MSPRKIFVFAMPRSGSTLLCDLLTVPRRGAILHEPMMLRRFGDGRERRIIQSLATHEISVDSAPEHFVRGNLARPWYDRHVIPKLSELEYWGVKEVFLEDADQLIREYTPDQLLLLWRDPRDVALSLLELMNRSLMSFSDRKTLKDEAWAMECIREATGKLASIAQHHPNLTIRYEDLMVSTEHQQAVLDYVGIEKFSDVTVSLSPTESNARTPEVQRHEERLSTKSLNRFKREPHGWRRTFAEVCHASVSHQASSAGYLPARLLASDVCAESTSPSHVRLGDPRYEPGTTLDFAYARRRARRKVAPLLTPGSYVLDVGASTASLAFLAANAYVTVVDDGVPGQRVLSKPWRQGIFPALDRFDTATFLFSLEYVKEPLRMILSLLQRKLKVIVTYHCIDDLSMSQRNALQFTSHLSHADWSSFASSLSIDFTCEWAFDGHQSLIILAPC